MSMLDTAAANRSAIGEFLAALDRAADDLGYEYVAEMVDIPVNDLRMKLDGDKDLTLAEANRIAIVTGVNLQLSLAEAVPA
ncbi:hypothetical protein [Microbacterium sp. 77mftsu3.1]|uniref:hypothetical protein n=1 Tax=Microbacterium sp. 77mftsu3.1 TaxID=1761802 RepID=UPI000382921B|nr:hypothetical protein [Microbacterium sp. 77mftsu3.1]SDH38020.1 hypothetical protein SAMN04488590_3183 [Microbacterium sp. 77mftsu3.1]